MLKSNNQISLTRSLIPIFFLISLLVYNIVFFENKDWFGENTYQIILLISASLCTIIGLIANVSINLIFRKIYSSIKSITTPIIIVRG